MNHRSRGDRIVDCHGMKRLTALQARSRHGKSRTNLIVSFTSFQIRPGCLVRGAGKSSRGGGRCSTGRKDCVFRKPTASVGAQGRNRTTDTAIFSRMLYQLSYLGTPRRGPGAPVYSQAGLPCPPRFACGWSIFRLGRIMTAHPGASWFETRGVATLLTMRVKDLIQRSAPPHCGKRAKWRSIGVFIVVLGGGNGVGIRQPAVEVDVAAAFGTKRPRGLGGRLAADRARLRLAGAGLVSRLSWHSTIRSGSENLRRRATPSSHTAAGRRHCCRNRPS